MGGTRPNRPIEPPRPPVSERLESWKDIANYLKRGVRTVQRWEIEEDLPVHRHVHDKLGTVYTYKAELDAWWQNGHDSLEAVEQPEETKAPTRRRLWWAIAAGAVAMAAVAAGVGLWHGFQNEPGLPFEERDGSSSPILRIAPAKTFSRARSNMPWSGNSATPNLST